MIDPQQLNRVEQKLDFALLLLAGLHSGVTKIMKQLDAMTATVNAGTAAADQLAATVQQAIAEIQNGTVDPAAVQKLVDQQTATNAKNAASAAALAAVLPQPAPAAPPATPAA